MRQQPPPYTVLSPASPPPAELEAQVEALHKEEEAARQLHAQQAARLQQKNARLQECDAEINAAAAEKEAIVARLEAANANHKRLHQE